MKTLSSQHFTRWGLPLSALVSLAMVLAATYYVQQRDNAPSATATLFAPVRTYSYYVQPEDWGIAAADADLVVRGTVQEMLPSVWTTPHGTAPTQEEWFNNSDYQIRTPVRLSIAMRFKGGDIGSTVTINVYGGTIGEDTIEAVDGTNNPFRKGSELILLLNRPHRATPAYGIIGDFVPSDYLVVEGETARGKQSSVPLASVIRQLERIEP